MANSQVRDLMAAVRTSDQAGPIVLELDTGTAIMLIAALQLACRHPAAPGSTTLGQAREFAERLQAGLVARDERLGLYLELGWHEANDVPCGG